MIYFQFQVACLYVIKYIFVIVRIYHIKCLLVSKLILTWKHHTANKLPRELGKGSAHFLSVFHFQVTLILRKLSLAEKFYSANVPNIPHCWQSGRPLQLGRQFESVLLRLAEIALWICWMDGTRICWEGQRDESVKNITGAAPKSGMFTIINM